MKLQLMYSNKKNIPYTQCVICKSTDKLEQHRIIKRGPYTESNVIILCKSHHSRYHNIERNNRFSHSEIMEVLIKLESEI